MANLNFKGKSIIQNHHLTVKYHQLIPKKNKSLTKNVSLKDNLIIHGDNLKALKALLPLYSGKIKCIYIDPPYNTGNEKWAYNDNVNSPMMKEWLGKIVDKDDLTRYDKWLCMMMPRIKLLRELLRTDGAIFISIDDNEQHHLRMILDDIFGEGNFVANILWQKRTSPDSRVVLGAAHDFIVCYAKDLTSFKETLNKLALTSKQQAQFKNLDVDARGPWVSSDFTAQGYRPNQMYTIITPSGKKYTPPEGRCWKNIESVYKKLLEEGRMWFGTDGKGIPRRKTYLSEREGSVPWTWWINKEVGHNQEAKKEIIDVLGKSTAFDTPKPSRLIIRILQIATEPDSIILDSFAGSGTTAHAVLALNKEDTGNRQFILVECEDYADTITAERVRRIIKGVPKAKDESLREGLGGSFSFFELGEPIEMESILEGHKLPEYAELARYIFYTATGEEFDISKLDKRKSFIGESKEYEVYLFYKPDIDYLKSTALTLDLAKSLGPYKGKKRLVFAPSKYLDLNDSELIEKHGIKGIEYCQLPFEIYKLKE